MAFHQNLAVEAKRLQAAGYAVMGIDISWNPVKNKKDVRFKRNWQMAIPETCLHTFFSNDDQGLAIVTGDKSDVLAVDFDVLKPKDIEQGVGDALAVVHDLIHKHGLHPSVPVAKTSSGGMHMLFRLSTTLEAGLQSAQNAAKCANLTMDIRADRGCIICFPTRIPHPDGPREYTWTQPIVPVTDLQPAPAWLIVLLNQRSRQPTAGLLEPVAKRQRVDQPEDNQLFTHTVKDQIAKLAPAQTIETIWQRHGGIDFRLDDMTCSCPLCGNTHTSNNYRARIILQDAFTLGNYSTSCRSQVFGWEADRLIQNLIGSPNTDDPYCNILHAIYQIHNRTVCFTTAKRFLTFNGIVWEELHPLTIKRDIKAIAQEVIKPLVCNIPKTEAHLPKIKALVAARKFLEKAHNISSVVQTYEVLSFDKDIEEQLDLDPDLLAVGNGVVDLRAGLLQPGRARQKLATGIPTKYRDAPTPMIDAFFNSVFNEDQDVISYMQRLLGYGITGHTSAQVWAIWTGSGSNGKSLLQDILKQLLGPFATMMPAELLFDTGKTTAGASTPHLQTLIKKRLGFKDESKAEKANILNEELIKTVTGSSTIITRPLYKDFIEFKPTHLPILLCNKKPRLNILDSAMMRRIVVVPFPNKYTSRDAKQDAYDESNPTHRLRDDSLLEKLSSKDGQEQLLTWLVHGAKAWYEKGLGAMPEQISKAFDDYKEENDTLATFIAESCSMDPKAKVNASTFLQAYNAATGAPVKQKVLKELMASKGFKYISSASAYRGLQLCGCDV